MRNLEDIITTAKSLTKRKNWYSSCVQYSIARSEFPTQFNDTLQNVINDDYIASILQGVLKELDKTNSIMSFGNTWNEDEILLLMTIRVNVQLIKEYFEFSNIAFPRLDFEYLDNNLVLLRDSKSNKKDYFRALGLMDKNGPKVAKNILPR